MENKVEGRRPVASPELHDATYSQTEGCDHGLASQFGLIICVPAVGVATVSIEIDED
jgi:hypothetical protein